MKWEMKEQKVKVSLICSYSVLHTHMHTHPHTPTHTHTHTHTHTPHPHTRTHTHTHTHTPTAPNFIREFAFQMAVRIQRGIVMERTQVEHMALTWIQTVRSDIHKSVYLSCDIFCMG